MWSLSYLDSQKGTVLYYSKRNNGKKYSQRHLVVTYLPRLSNRYQPHKHLANETMAKGIAKEIMWSLAYQDS